jgi:hypothetical protein
MNMKLILVFCKETCLAKARTILKEHDALMDVELGNVVETLSTKSHPVEEWPGYTTILMAVAPADTTEKIVSALSRYREEMHPAIQQGVKILVLPIEKEI